MTHEQPRTEVHVHDDLLVGSFQIDLRRDRTLRFSDLYRVFQDLWHLARFELDGYDERS